MPNGTYSLTTSPSTLFDCRTIAEGGDGLTNNLADQVMQRLEAVYVTNDSASANVASVKINGEAAGRPIAPGVTLAFRRRGKIKLVTAVSAGTSTVYFGELMN